MSHGKKLKQLRELAGVSQAKVAHLLGLDRAFVSMVESGLRNFTKDDAGKVEEYLRREIRARAKELQPFSTDTATVSTVSSQPGSVMFRGFCPYPNCSAPLFYDERVNRGDVYREHLASDEHIQRTRPLPDQPTELFSDFCARIFRDLLAGTASLNKSFAGTETGD